MKNDTTLAPREFVKESGNYELFKSKTLASIHNTVRAVLVIFCLDGVAFLQEIYKGLNKLNNICGIMIYPFGSLNGDKVREMLPDMTNLHLVDNDVQALDTLKQLIHNASDLSYKSDRGNMEI